MRTAQEKLSSLDEKSVWAFTKQSSVFDSAFKAAKLFSEIKDVENTNIEEYFSTYSDQYNVETNRHRILVISQLFGLITKGTFNARGLAYKNEKVTQMFDKLNGCEFGGEQYNIYKTEQILKVKMHAIIDSANNNLGWNILPVIFTFQVLYELQKIYGINKISLDSFYTYIATSEKLSDLHETIELIKNNSPASPYVGVYKGFSRIEPLIRNNINLFNFEDDCISLNDKYANYFVENFINVVDMDGLYNKLARDIDYADFLYNCQEFNINLITTERSIVSKKRRFSHHFIKVNENNNVLEEDNDNEYIDIIDSISDDNINIENGALAFSVEPKILKIDNVKRYSKNPTLGKMAIKISEHKCQNQNAHITFESRTNHKDYMEAHHLIPIFKQDEIWEKYGVNIDCLENLISLCPTCHRAIHYGTNNVKKEIITKLFNLKQEQYKAIGLNIDLDTLLGFYRVFE